MYARPSVNLPPSLLLMPLPLRILLSLSSPKEDCQGTGYILRRMTLSVLIGTFYAVAIGHVYEYPTMHNIGIPRHTQSMIAYTNLTEYSWKSQSKIA